MIAMLDMVWSNIWGIISKMNYEISHKMQHWYIEMCVLHLDAEI